MKTKKPTLTTQRIEILEPSRYTLAIVEKRGPKKFCYRVFELTGSQVFSSEESMEAVKREVSKQNREYIKDRNRRRDVRQIISRILD